MNGLKLARDYYIEYGEPMLRENFPELLPYMCAALVGSGSECLGFDDELSEDHDFEPGFCLFIPGEDLIDSKIEFKLERAYAKLPKEFRGYERQSMAPAGGPRHGVFRTKEFYEGRLGEGVCDLGLSVASWFNIPEHLLLQATNGEVFMDNYGEFTRIRQELAYLPEDIRLKKLAGNLAIMRQSGQYNYERCLKHGETGSAQLALGEFVKSTLACIFLLNKKYLPFYKWQFRALRDLPKLSGLSELLEVLISTGNEPELADGKLFALAEIAEAVVEELKAQELTDAVCYDFSKHAYSVNDRISDAAIRNADIFAGVRR